MVWKEMEEEDKLRDELLRQERNVVCGCVKSRKKKFAASEMKANEKNEDTNEMKADKNDEVNIPPAKKIALVKDELQEIKSPEYFSDEIEEGEIIDDDIMTLDSVKG